MKSKVRVLHVIGGGDFGGAEQHILSLLSHLPKDEWETAVVCFYDSVFARKLREAGIRVLPLAGYGRFDFRILFGLQRMIREYKPDLVHSHGVKANFFSRLAARRSGPVVITTVHSYLRYDYPNAFAYGIATAMERSTRHLNHHFIAVSDAIRNILLQEGIPSRQISLIYNGIDLTPFRKTEQTEKDRARLRAEWGIPADAFVFGTVARFVPVKGLPVLVEAFARWKERNPGNAGFLVLVGDGQDRPLLEQTARDLGVGNDVIFTGFRKDIPNCLHAFDAFVMSSYHEGLPYTILEAEAAGLPVAATSVGGIREFVVPGENGLLVPSGSADALAAAMQTLTDDPVLRSRIVASGMSRVEESFTIEHMTNETASLYRTLLANKQSCTQQESET